MYNSSARNTNEVRTAETVLISFSSDGTVNWDHSVTLDEKKMPGIEQVSDYCLVGDQLYIIYKKESELKLKVIGLEDEQVNENTIKITTDDPQDEIRSDREFEGGVRQWSSDSFFVWGYQSIRNPTKEERVRDVFYINKLVVK
jgi:hypothetical protein